MVATSARAKIAPYKVPQYVWMVDEFPLTTSGKVQKFKLREMAAANVKREAEARGKSES